ncbi:MAG: hypothetical protein EXS01_01805 [Phycisphaerales bacterium]|nr:hypothetical protein [Phycisphaerales bacterium]
MDTGANLRDTRTIMAAKAVLTKAARSFGSAIEESQSDAERFGMWLTGEGPTFWEGQRRKLTEKLNIDRAALFRKQIQMTADGRPPSTVDEKKAVVRAEHAVRHAEHCLRELRRWSIEYQRVLAQFRAGMGPLSTYVDQIVPAAVIALNRMAESIDAYISTAPAAVDDTAQTAGDQTAIRDPASAQQPDQSMRRGGSDARPENPPNE